MLRNSIVCMGRANTTTSKTELRLSKSLSYAPLAQSVEHAAVNRSVVGSSPTRGANALWRHTANMDSGVLNYHRRSNCNTSVPNTILYRERYVA